MNRAILAFTLLVLVTAPAAWADLTKAKAQPNLERRARLALDNAAAQFRVASEAYKAGGWTKTVAAFEEIRDSVDLAYESLNQTGKNPRNSSQFKNLEVKLRGLLKNLGDLLQSMAFEERERLAPLVNHLQDVHDEVLESVMSSKRKD